MPSLGPRVPQTAPPVLPAWKLLDLIYNASLSPESWATVFGTLGSLIEARPTTAVLKGFGPTRYVNCDSPEEGFQEISPIQMFTTKALSHRGFVIAVVDDEIVEDWAKLPTEGSEPSTSLALFNAQGLSLSDATIGTLKRVLPHIHRALQIHFTLDHFERDRDALVHCLDAIAPPLFLVDTALNVSFANEAAEQLCDEHSGIDLDNHRLRLERADDHAAMLELTRDAAVSSDACAARRLTDGWTAFAIGTDSGWVVVSFSTATAARELPPQLVEHALGWTPDEAKVGALFASGRSVSEIAGQLSMRPPTVRATIKSIQTRMGATRQTELLRLVLETLPPFPTTPRS